MRTMTILYDDDDDDDDDDDIASAKWSRLNAGENSFSQTKGIRPEIIPWLQKVVNYLDFLVRSPALTPFPRCAFLQAERATIAAAFISGHFLIPSSSGVLRRLGTIAISRGSLIGCQARDFPRNSTIGRRPPVLLFSLETIKFGILIFYLQSLFRSLPVISSNISQYNACNMNV